MYVEKLIIKNFRCFGTTEIVLNYPGQAKTLDRSLSKSTPNVNLLVGGNGSGKSTVFKALALGVLAPIIGSSGMKAEYLVRRLAVDANSSISNGHAQGKTPASKKRARQNADVRAYLRLDAADAEVLPALDKSLIGQAVISLKGDVEKVTSAHNNELAWQRLYENASSAFFLVGYGASRRTERPEGYSELSRTVRYQRVASLFEEQVGLVPFTYAYLQLRSRETLIEARNILNSLLVEERLFLTHKQDSQDRPLFDNNGVLLPFDALSDGFRAFIGWVWDLLLQMSRVLPPEHGANYLTDLAGIVVVDEIDLFLHPEWQRRVVEQVAKAFPRIQFLFSTHSPLVAGTLEPQNIYVLDTGDDGSAVVEQYAENIFGLTANQVLTSSYFQLHSTRAPGAPVNELTRLALSENDEDRMTFLRRMAGSIPQE